MPLHIVIDVRRLRDFGIGTYIRNLLRALAHLDQENHYTLIAQPQDLDQVSQVGPNFQGAAYSRPDTDALHNVSFPYFLRSFRADLFHIPLNSVAWWMPRPYVVTIHDMSTLLFPARSDFRHTLHEERYRRGAARAARVITVSHSTRRDVETVLYLPKSQVRTIYSAPDPAFTSEEHDPTQDCQLLERYSITYPFILYAGAIRAQKNVARLVEAFAVLRHELEKHPRYRELRLVIIGDELSKHPSVRHAVAHSRIEQAVRFLGFVPLDTLRVFYHAAELFAFPSLYEGFGLPPLEAMACGTPVVASNIPSLIEAVGEAAELVSPDNVFDIARGLREVLLDQGRRARMAASGREQASHFHWGQTAREVLEVYQEAARPKK
jgi:glycosyltransferase involved in cell wall biosynthesis